tara:strand:+ start:2235 stop:2513 length:279 start_codon:yes stop_codon:yes gene_type:complete
MYGDRLTGYDMVEATKVWLKKNGGEEKSVCEILRERGWEGIGEAEVFLSHVQAETPKETMEAMRDIDRRFPPPRARSTTTRGSGSTTSASAS